MHVSCLCKFRTSGYGDPDGIHSSFRKIEYSICAFFVQLILFSAQTASELGEEIVFYECQTISEWKLLMSSEFHHRSKIIVLNFFYISIEKMNIHLFSHSDFPKIFDWFYSVHTYIRGMFREIFLITMGWKIYRVCSLR